MLDLDWGIHTHFPYYTAFMIITLKRSNGGVVADASPFPQSVW